MVVVVRLVRGDLAKQSASALVTSANDALCGNDQPLYWRFTSRKNVDGAVREAGGPRLREACLALKALTPTPVEEGGPRRDISRWEQTAKRGASATQRCAPGDAIATRAFGALDADHVIHAVAPDSEFMYEGHYQGRPDGDKDRAYSSVPLRILARTYVSVFDRARGLRAASLAVPSLGSGVKGWRPAISAAVALDTLVQNLATGEELFGVVAFVLGDDASWVAWTRTARLLLGPAHDDTTLADQAIWHLSAVDLSADLDLSLVPELLPRPRAKSGWAGDYWKPTNNGW
ncbi:hypothetical protein CTAYLR_003694 [Chrysophaeum taylorii]|uniref:Macro domain-containing protein n=1 Tax=Chrysophaeum taylorii TaxID=2483200 RepID=A0AAD7UNV4_9STRA|nr:hypothetical protein CTAYLR_003694 [Chrysophaeum taylorii]